MGHEITKREREQKSMTECVCRAQYDDMAICSCIDNEQVEQDRKKLANSVWELVKTVHNPWVHKPWGKKSPQR